MGQALSILIEVAILLGFAGLYYYFQRRKILRRDKIEIMQIFDELISKNTENSDATKYLAELTEANEQCDYPRLLELSQHPHSSLPEETKSQLHEMDNRINFYVRKK